MKKRLLALLFVLVLPLCVFCACEDGLPDIPDNTGNPVSVKVIVLDLGYVSIYEKELETEKSTLYELFAELDGLQVETTVSAFAWVNAVSVIDTDGFTVLDEIRGGTQGGAYYFVSIFHDVDDILMKDLSRDFDIRYEEKDYYLSGVGVSGLSLKDGATYVMKLVESV